MEQKFLQVLKGKSFESPPIWIMRQAGRYLPEYRETRKLAKNFLELCYNPELATEVTLQPIRRFNFDASIIFSDILVIPDALGVDVKFIENIGPVLEPVNSAEKLAALNFGNFSHKLNPVYQAIKLTRAKLPKETTLIGFVGSPWTIATYILQGKSSKDFSEAKIIAYKNEDFFVQLFDMLVEAIIIHISKQIEAGAEVIQLFDSWAGILDETLFNRCVIEPTKKIVDEVKKTYPHIPLIGFPKGAGLFYKDYIDALNIDAIGCDSSLKLDYIINLPKKVTIQGNLDNTILFADKSTIRNEVMKILDKTRDRSFIFNLGHGILPKTPIENVEYLIEIVRNYK